MNYIFDLLIVVFSISVAANGALTYLLINLKKKKPQMTYDARALLADLASGPALVKIEYLDRGDVLLRSPRHMS